MKNLWPNPKLNLGSTPCIEYIGRCTCRQAPSHLFVIGEKYKNITFRVRKGAANLRSSCYQSVNNSTYCIINCEYKWWILGRLDVLMYTILYNYTFQQHNVFVGFRHERWLKSNCRGFWFKIVYTYLNCSILKSEKVYMIIFVRK